MDAKSMGERLGQYMAEKGVSQSELARRVGIKQQTINYLIKSHSQGSSYAVRIASALGVNPAWLQDGIGAPLDNTVSVGSGSGLSSTKAHWIYKLKAEQVRDFLSGGGDAEAPRVVTAVDVSPGSFALDVVGRSMAPELIEGDELVVDVGLKAEPGDYVAALLGEALLLRRYREVEAGFELVPLNPDFPVVRSASGCTLVGVVVEHRRRLKR